MKNLFFAFMLNLKIIGVGLLDIVIGLLAIVGTIAAYQYPRLRLLEEELPDAIRDIESG
ncbi:MAG: hypothetical protein F6K23_00520 [Okeania sp. SIO2C9]|uniref:hypothetical protein n=1 Tax=Okeania sp. SIO2C9 TaxID=2607791 RepID=UPI0013C0171F|nr:hypothetical protein [Okeania sp. SIO2C9]NEQ71696.1 hypothetical protein [Okeania sp. SIO2C9]